jgi:hypothetical protein
MDGMEVALALGVEGVARRIASQGHFSRKTNHKDRFLL